MNVFPRTVAAIEAGIRDKLHLGVQIYVSRNREPLWDEVFGEAREGILMRRDSIMAWFSAGKPLTAVAVAQLVERGRLNWEMPVDEVIPEFAQKGKESTTIRHLLTHTACLRNADAIDDAMTWDEMIARISSLPPELDCIAGATAGYHVSGTWYLLGEIVRRVGGMPIDEYVRENILRPLSLYHSSLALTVDEVRTCGDRIALVYDTSGESLRPKEEWNDEAGLTRCRPGGSARGPIRELGTLYEALLAGGGRILKPQTVATITSRQRMDMFDKTFQFKMDWGFGFIINSSRDVFQMPYGYGRYATKEAFGHSSNQVSCAFADPAHRLVVAWACNGMPGERKHQQRQRAINNAIYEDLGLANPSSP